MEKLKQAIKAKLTEDNFYVRKFMKDFAVDDIKDCENGAWYRQEKVSRLSQSESLSQAIENLIEDESGYFEEFILDELKDAVVEYMRDVCREVAND